MGVDFHKCDNCGDIYADCGPCGSCEGCDRRWCGDCDEKLKSFFYNEKIRCDLCFITKPVKPNKRALLDLACKKLNMSIEQLKQELVASDEKYRQPQDVYHCTEDKANHDCKEGTCTLIASDWDGNLKYEDYSTEIQRGICCAAKYPEKEDRGYWCLECQKSKKIKTSD